MTFAHPWFLLLLLGLPLIGWWSNKRRSQAAFLYSSVQLIKPITGITKFSARRYLAALRWIALATFIIGLARPQRVQTETSFNASGIDIAVAIDLSGSMESEDFERRGEPVNRLEIAKDVIKTFVGRRPGDRIGLVAFAGRAYVASPLTLDHDFLLQNIERLQLHMIEDGTAIGSGLTTAVNRLKDLKSKSKIIILMTDGQNTAGKVQPITAAEAAKALAIKVYTIGVGTQGYAPVPYLDVFGQKRYSRQKVDIDEETLKNIADLTGGKYYRADSSATLKTIYEEIDSLEKTEVEVKKFVQVEEIFSWAVFPGLLVLMLEIILSNTVWRRLP